jgi:sialidase-1
MRSRRRFVASIASTALVFCGAAATFAVGSRQHADAAVVQQVLFDKNTNGYGCYRIPAIVRTKSNTLLAFAEARVSWCGDSGDIDLVVRRSMDNGRTWGPQNIVLSGTDSNPSAVATRGNPVPIVDQTTGRIALLTTFDPGTTNRPRTPYSQYSDDDGVTWSTAKNIESSIDDPSWGWYATGPAHGIQLQRGPHAGRLVAGVNFTDASGRSGAALVYSDNGGGTWQRGATEIRTDAVIAPQELNLFERTDGGIYAAARDNGGTSSGSRAFAVSRDSGATFESPFAMVTDVTTPESGVQGSVLRVRATDQGDKYNRVLFASPADPVYRKKLTIWSSYNEGKTWSSAVPKQITADRSGYSDMAVLATGEIGLLYEGGPDTSTGDAHDQIRFTRFTESDLGMPDSTAGTLTPDLSGAGNDSYLHGGATLTATGGGRFDEAVSLNGVDGSVHLPFAESLALGAGDFTAMAWIKYSATTGGNSIFWGYNVNAHSQFWLRAEPGDSRIRGLIQSGSNYATVSSAKAYNDNAWHHVSLQRAGTVLNLWVDGAVVGSAAAPAGTISPDRPFTMEVGEKIGSSDYFKGLLDEVRIYRRALTASEFGAIRTTNASNVPDAVLRLPFTAAGPSTADTSRAHPR